MRNDSRFPELLRRALLSLVVLGAAAGIAPTILPTGMVGTSSAGEFVTMTRRPAGVRGGERTDRDPGASGRRALPLRLRGAAYDEKHHAAALGVRMLPRRYRANALVSATAWGYNSNGQANVPDPLVAAEASGDPRAEGPT